jgi:hypothetical protein
MFLVKFYLAEIKHGPRLPGYPLRVGVQVLKKRKVSLTTGDTSKRRDVLPASSIRSPEVL